MASFSFAPTTEEEFLACEADYTVENQATENFEAAHSSSEEVILSPATYDQSCACGSNNGATSANDVRQVDQHEYEQVNTMVNRSCGCKLGEKGTACSTQFTRETIVTQREQCLTLNKELLDMLVLGQFQAHTADTSTEDTSRQKYVVFYFKGKRICRKYFMFIHTLSQKNTPTFLNIMLHVAHFQESMGICTKLHIIVFPSMM